MMTEKRNLPGHSSDSVDKLEVMRHVDRVKMRKVVLKCKVFKNYDVSSLS